MGVRGLRLRRRLKGAEMKKRGEEKDLEEREMRKERGNRRKEGRRRKGEVEERTMRNRGG